MVIPSAMTACQEMRAHAMSVPVIDLSQRSQTSQLIVKACEEVGFFKVVGHGVPSEIIARMEYAAEEFFALPASSKVLAGPPTPLGYGVRDIGRSGDVGELEYLLLHTCPAYISEKAMTISSNDPALFSKAVTEYVEALRQLACEILDMLSEGLGLSDTKAFSRLISDTESDSLLRINRYPPNHTVTKVDDDSIVGGNLGNIRVKDDISSKCTSIGRVGFGEHSDPQFLSILRSNDAEGLQVLLPNDAEGVWIPIAADPSAFFVNVGELLQAMTNGRLVSIRHRAMANSFKPRMSTVYFGAPPLQALIYPLPEMINPKRPCRYRPFTWAEYKKTMYSLPLSCNRLDLFQKEGFLELRKEGSDFL